MRFRTTLTDPGGNSKVLSEPEGMTAIIAGLTRHPELHSLVKEYKTSLRLYGSNGTQDGGRDWLKNVESLYGPDAVVQELIEVAEDDYNFTEFSRSEVGIQTFVEDNGYALDHGLEYTAVQLGFWRKVMNRFDVPVDIQSTVNLDGETVVVITPTSLKLTGQIINKTTSYTGHTGDNETAQDCLAATTGNITLSGIQTIDGVLGFSGRRVLVKDQTDQTENGTYIEDISAWTRTADGNTGAELEVMIVKILQGSINSNKVFKQQTNPLTIGSSNVVFTEYNYVDDYVLFEQFYSDAGVYKNIHISANAEIELSEIDSSFNLGFVAFEDPADLVEQIEIDVLETGPIQIHFEDFAFKFIGSIVYVPGLEDMSIKAQIFYQINDEAIIQIGSDYDASGSSELEINETLNTTIDIFDGPSERIFRQGDRIKVYFKFGIRADNAIALAKFVYRGGILGGKAWFTFKSSFQDTTIQSFLLHDVCASVVDRIGDEGSFYSELLGSPQTLARIYENTGCYWANMLAKGLHWRGYTLAQKKFSISMKEIWEGINPHLNLSMGYEEHPTLGNVIRLEEKSYQYDSSQMSVLLSGVQRIRRKYTDQYYNSVETGNSKGLIEDISGIDDPYKQTRASIFKNIGRKLILLSGFITQGLTLEWIRRSVITKSADNKYDNDTIMVEVINEGDGYKPKIDQDYDSVTGLLNEETRYNKRWTPARMFIRWSNVIFSGVQNYLGTVYRFVSGEGNYDMTSERKPDSCSDNYDGAVLAENADIPVTSNHLYIPIEYEIEHYLTIQEFKTIDSKKRFSIGVSQFPDGHKHFFIKDLQYEMMTGQIKLTGYFKDPFDIITVPPGGQIFQGGKIFDASFDFSFE